MSKKDEKMCKLTKKEMDQKISEKQRNSSRCSLDEFDGANYNDTRDEENYNSLYIEDGAIVSIHGMLHGIIF